MPSQTALHRNSIALSAQLVELGGAAPSVVRLLPAGRFKAKDGRPQGLPGWRLDAPEAEALIAQSAAQTDRFLIDYDHQTLHAKDNGAKAPAAGWFSQLEWRADDGLYATDVEWTAAAQAAIEAKEYRYISPVLAFNPKTGQVTGLLMAAIVNYPALDGLTDLAAAGHVSILATTEPTPMDDLLEHLRYFLNLPLSATPEDMVAELDKLKARLAGADMAEAGLAGFIAGLQAQLAAGSEELAALAAQVAAPPDPAQYVPVSAMAALQTELSELSARVKADQLDKLIEPALADGRLLPPQKDWAYDLGQKDLAALQAFLATAQPIEALRGSQTGGVAPSVAPLAAEYRPADGYVVDAERAALHARALAFQRQHNVDYSTAAAAVGA